MTIVEVCHENSGIGISSILQPRALPRLAALDLGLLQGLGHLVECGEGHVDPLEDRADLVVLETLGHPVIPVIAHASPRDLELLHRFLHPPRSGNDVSRVHGRVEG